MKVNEAANEKCSGKKGGLYSPNKMRVKIHRSPSKQDLNTLLSDMAKVSELAKMQKIRATEDFQTKILKQIRDNSRTDINPSQIKSYASSQDKTEIPAQSR